jgi:uncharacterized protein YhfF
MFAGLRRSKTSVCILAIECADTFPIVEAATLQFWRDFVATFPGEQDRPETPANVFAFGESKELADELALLVRQGRKTATCSALWGYEEEQKPLPRKGDYSIVLDGNDIPVAVIETVEVFVVPFNEVSERFAYDEGEGDRSLAYWREAHRNFFGCQRFHDRIFAERMPLVCKRFRLVYSTGV